MKSYKKLSQFLAILSIAQVLVLSLASVSPDLHFSLFHSASLHSVSHAADAQGCDHHHKNESKHSTHDDPYCAVSLFSQGVCETGIIFISSPRIIEFGDCAPKAGENIYFAESYNIQPSRAPPIC